MGSSDRHRRGRVHESIPSTRGKAVRFYVNQFRQLWSRATGWDTAQAQFEAMLTSYDELRTPRADKRFSIQWSIRTLLDKIRGKFLDWDYLSWSLSRRDISDLLISLFYQRDCSGVGFPYLGSCCVGALHVLPMQQETRLLPRLLTSGSLLGKV